MVAVEEAWLDALVGAGIAPGAADGDLAGLVGADDVDGARAQAPRPAATRSSALVALLRDGSRPATPRRHAGCTAA